MSFFFKVHIGSREAGRDEVHGLGSGVRILAITSQDRKWVHLRCPTTGNIGKVRVSVWNDMKPAEVVYRKKYVSAWWKKDAPFAWNKLKEMAA